MSKKKKNKKAKKPRRPAVERNKREKAARKLVRDRDRLAALEPGGTNDRPLTVESAAVVEARARALKCHQCDGELAVEDHRVEQYQGELLRAVDLRCKRCHSRRLVWVRVQPALPN